jgi:stage V sporulation protein R
MYSKFLRGGPLLTGNNTVPGQTLTQEEKEIFTKVLQACKDYGLDFYPTIIQKLTHDEMSEIVAYGGFPRRYPHWKWGMEYEELQRSYELGLHRVYEIVTNSSPCVIYIMNSNSLVDNVTVVAHATGHNDFFKNNIYFSPTDQNMMNKLANHGSRVRRYMDRWGNERVTEFIDHVLRIQTLIDLSKAWSEREINDIVIRDSRTYEYPRRLNVDDNRLYMDPWVNPKSFRDKENARIEKKEIAKELGLLEEPDKDIFGFIRNNAPLKPWQADIVSMLYEEAMYFGPQRLTKTNNEAAACLHPDSLIYTDNGLARIGQIVKNRMDVSVFDGKKVQKVTNWFTFEDRKIYRIKTKRGYEIKGSDTHKIYTKDGWKQMNDCVIGDRIRIAKGGNLWAKSMKSITWVPYKRLTFVELCKKHGVSYTQVKRYRKGHVSKNNDDKIKMVLEEYALDIAKCGGKVTQSCRRHSINIPKYMHKKFATFLGFLTGDGHISEVSREIGFTNGEEYLADMFIDLARELFGLVCTKRWDDRSLNGRWRISTHSKELEELLKSFGIPTGVCARLKKVPDIILQSPKNVVSAFLRAYFDADGCAAEKSVILSTSSPEMAKQVQIVLLNYGILSSIYAKEKDNYHVCICSESIKVFYQEIGFNSPTKQKKLCEAVYGHPWFNKQDWTDEIVSVEEIGQETVYDITVEDTHRYAAQGFINHNSFIDYEIMTRQGYVGLGQKTHDAGIIQYSLHKMGVLGGQYSMNPYKLGFYLHLDIEERWNKGQFGTEWENCKNLKQKEDWDLNLGLGKQKLFEVRKYYDDVGLIHEFFTQEFCDKFEFFEWKRYPNGEYKIESRDAKRIKKKLLQKHLNGGLPDIRLVEPNHRGRGWLMLQHWWDGRTLYEPYVREVMSSLYYLWGKEIVLATKNKDEEEVVFICVGNDADKDIALVGRAEYEAKW